MTTNTFSNKRNAHVSNVNDANQCAISNHARCRQKSKKSRRIHSTIDCSKMSTLIQRKDDCLLQHRQKKQMIDENVELFRVSSSRQREKKQITTIQTRENFVDRCHQFVEIEFERVEYSRHHSCESISKFVEIYAKKRTNETK